MRLWHKDLIPVLPRQQLLAQWRECCAIARNIAINGTPNHLLVDKVLKYPVIHFTCYIDLVLNEMRKRNYKISEKAFVTCHDNIVKGQEHFSHTENQYAPAFTSSIYAGWHDDRYLRQCFYNLQEKFDCGGIPEDEWRKVQQFYEGR